MRRANLFVPGHEEIALGLVPKALQARVTRAECRLYIGTHRQRAVDARWVEFPIGVDPFLRCRLRVGNAQQHKKDSHNSHKMRPLTWHKHSGKSTRTQQWNESTRVYGTLKINAIFLDPRNIDHRIDL